MRTVRRRIWHRACFSAVLLMVLISSSAYAQNFLFDTPGDTELPAADPPGPAADDRQTPYPRNLGEVAWYGYRIMTGAARPGSLLVQVERIFVLASDGSLYALRSAQNVPSQANRTGGGLYLQTLWQIDAGIRRIAAMYSDQTSLVLQTDDAIWRFTLEAGIAGSRVSLPSQSSDGRQSSSSGKTSWFYLDGILGSQTGSHISLSRLGTRILEWDLPVDSAVFGGIDAAGSLLFIDGNMLLRFSLDGVPSDVISADKALGTPEFAGALTMFELGSGAVRSYDVYAADRYLYSIRASDGRKLIYTSRLVSGNILQIYLRDGRVYGSVSSNGDGSQEDEELLLALEDSWQFTTSAASAEMVVLADNTWRIHAVKPAILAADIWGEQLRPPEPVATGVARAQMLGDLLVSVDSAERSELLSNMADRLESGGGRGVLLQYRGALEILLDSMYGVGTAVGGQGGGDRGAVGFTIAEWESRAALVRLVGLTGSEALLRRSIFMMRYEVHPAVLEEILAIPGFAERGDDPHLRNVIDEYLQKAEPWQLSESLMDVYAEYLFALLDSGVGSSQREITRSLMQLYELLRDPQRRREILNRMS